MRVSRLSIACLAALVILFTGCRQQTPAVQPRTDQELTADVQAKIQSESALAGQNIQVAVNNGVVTLNGTSADASSRALAGTDTGLVPGVKAVVNNLEIRPAGAMSALSQPAPRPEPKATHNRNQRSDKRAQPKSEKERAEESAPTPAAAAASPTSVLSSPVAPERGPRSVTLAAGTVIPVRITESLDSETAEPNQTFHATVATDLERGGVVVIPQGTPVLGRVADAKSAARFKGSSLLALELTRIDLQHKRIAVTTDTFSKEGAGRGKNTAQKVGGGAVVGAVIGALAGGSKGAAIGAAAGAGAGAGVNAATRGEQIKIASETLLNFTLQQSLSITTNELARTEASGGESELSQRAPQ